MTPIGSIATKIGIRLSIKDDIIQVAW
jgi:hypothetical protein